MPGHLLNPFGMFSGKASSIWLLCLGKGRRPACQGAIGIAPLTTELT
jgi:hypothetical protein